jgi:CheY-like chemotaxis protein
LLARNLAELGCEVAEAGDGRAALESLKGGGFALALIDCQLPELDGFALARKLRRFEGETGVRRLRLIGMSAETSAAQTENCTAAGMDGFLPKPFGRADLEALLRQARSPAES